MFLATVVPTPDKQWCEALPFWGKNLPFWGKNNGDGGIWTIGLSSEEKALFPIKATALDGQTYTCKGHDMLQGDKDAHIARDLVTSKERENTYKEVKGIVRYGGT